MALDNPQLIEWANDEARQVADLLVEAKLRADSFISEYNARGLGTIINDGGSSGPILDGSATDGRTIPTGGDAFNLVTLATDFQTFMTPGRWDVLFKWQVNGNKLQG